MPVDSLVSSFDPPRRVDMADPQDVQYWVTRFCISERQLRTAIEQVGDSADTVERWLKISAGTPQHVAM